ncbi:MAG: M29 family metallopeptidase [Thermoplasmata archaeon]
MAPEESAPTALARRLVGDALAVRAGETVLIESWNHTLTYAAACVVEARRRGAHPMLLLEDEVALWRSADGPVRGLGRPGAHELAALARTDAYVHFPGPADRARYRSVPGAFRAVLDGEHPAWKAAARRARVRSVRCALGYASEPQAAFWGVSATTWRGQLLKAALEPDLKGICRDGRRARDLLARGRELRVTSANGTDLRLRLKGRVPVVDDGIVGPEDRALGHLGTLVPPGNVIVAPDETSAEGTVIGSRPSFLPWGRADGGQWELHEGHLASAWFTEGRREFEEAVTAAAPRGRNVVSLLAVGLNPSLAAGTPQVEDQELGAVTIAVGGNRAYGGSVSSSFLAWIVVGEATVAIDGRPLLDRGKLLGE